MSDHGLKNVEAFERMVAFCFKGMSRPSLGGRFYTFAKIDPVQAVWYYGAECSKCKRTTPAFKDSSNGKLGNVFLGPGGLHLTCRFCSSKIEASAPEVIAFQWV